MITRQSSAETTAEKTLAMPAVSFMPVRSGSLQRKCVCGGAPDSSGECEACRKEKPQSKTRHLQPGTRNDSFVPPMVHEVLHSEGQPLDRATRAFMEPCFGHDFSQVRVHTGPRAIDSAEALRALAFTAGRDIVFGGGQYSPRTLEGQRLLAHELAHVVQQRGSKDAGVIDTGSEQRLEHEADLAAERTLTGGHTWGLSPTSTAALQRQSSATRPAQTTPPTVRRDRQLIANAGRDGGRFDAMLDREQSLLTITMRVAFDFQSVPGPLNEPWTPERMSQWKSDFIRLTVTRWSDRYVLAPDGACPTENMSEVRVLIAVQEDNLHPHFQVGIDNQEMLESSGVSRADRHGRFHAPDVREQFHPDSGTRQTTAEHEFGHMLGVHHIRCEGNQPDCYGVTPAATQQEKEDVMGVGSEVSGRDYEVFTEVLQQATQCRWKVQEKSSSLGILALIGGLAVAAGIGFGIAAAAGVFSH